MDMEAERLARKNALDSAHNKARDEYFKAFEQIYRAILEEHRDALRALTAADGAARRAYVETHCAVYKEVCGKERANYDADTRQPERAALCA
jgi:hypothetical protein